VIKIRVRIRDDPLDALVVGVAHGDRILATWSTRGRWWCRDESRWEGEGRFQKSDRSSRFGQKKKEEERGPSLGSLVSWASTRLSAECSERILILYPLPNLRAWQVRGVGDGKGWPIRGVGGVSVAAIVG
jgi:hypothetical protein